MRKEEKKKTKEYKKQTSLSMRILKVVILLIVISAIVFFTIKIGPLFKGLLTEEGRILFKERIDDMGFQSVLIVIGLIFVQIFIAILPGEPVELLAGMCFGPIGGMLVCFVGMFLSTAIIFFAVRKFGRDFIYTFISKEKIDKLENAKIWKEEEKVDLIMFTAFFIPATPKDIFTYIGGLLPINPWRFLMIATFARFPSVISSTIAGSSILSGNWIVIVASYVITFALSGLLIHLSDKRRKKKALRKEQNKNIEEKI